jgi:hypothetical protein
MGVGPSDVAKCQGDRLIIPPIFGLSGDFALDFMPTRMSFSCLHLSGGWRIAKKRDGAQAFALILSSMKKRHRQPYSPIDRPLERRKASRLLSGMRKKKRLAISHLDPGRKMKAAFSLSVEARKLLIAGLKAQGFSESEIRRILREKRR